MTNTLYRKYRPANFGELTGQQHIKITLQNQVQSGKIAHAYLFTGPRGVGKTTTARIFAAAINSAGEKEARDIIDGHDLDVIEVDAASHSGVQNVRENIIESARFTPHKRKYKVFIIDEVHMLSTEAFNALLKLLEEPPAHAIFILATTELHKVPATIVSRCQRYDFKKISYQDMMTRLAEISASEGIKIESEVLAVITRVAEGCLRDAESLLGQLMALGGKNITLEQAQLVLPQSLQNEAISLLELLSRKDAAGAMTQAESLIVNGADVFRFMGDVLEMLRAILLYQQTKGKVMSQEGLSEALEKKVISLSQELSLERIIFLIEVFAKRRLEVKTAVLPSLPLEVAVAETCYGEIAQKKTLEIASSKPQSPSMASTAKTVTSSVSSGGVKEQSGTSKTSANISPGSVSVDHIKGKWSNLLSHLQQSNPSLVLILKTAEPMSLDSEFLTIGYKYPFHKQRMEQPVFSDLLEAGLAAIHGAALKVKHVALASGYKSDFIKEHTEGDEVELLADAFVAANASPMPQTQSAPQPQAQLSQSKSSTTPTTTAANNRGLSSEELIKNLVSAFGGKIVE